MDVPVLFVVILFVGHVKSWSGSEYYNDRYSTDGISYDGSKLNDFFKTDFIFINCHGHGHNVHKMVHIT